MTVKKITFYFVNFDELDDNEIEYEISNVSYPNDCITPMQVTIETADIGEWSDDHRCNQIGYCLSNEFNK